MSQSQDHIYLQTVPRPVAAMSKSYPAGYVGYRHTHRRAQFLYAESGTMRLTRDEGCWLVPPHRAVWLPAEYPHQTGSLGPLEMRTLYIEPSALPAAAPCTVRMLSVSPLTHHLVLRACAMQTEYDEAGQDSAVVKALIGEIDWTPLDPLSLPTIHDPRLRIIERCIMDTPEKRRSLDSWSEEFGVATRTLSRLIQGELGLPFSVWRDRMLAFAAVAMLTEGQQVVRIADALGFETAWSFTAMFKRVTGCVPSRFLRMNENDKGVTG